VVAVGCVLGEVRTVVQGERGVGGDERGGGDGPDPDLNLTLTRQGPPPQHDA
jgi:hypothetical protein